ncbi:MAG TPA: gliding motility-associated C-terminal domain-containing protein, partial [Cytophagaceae bacterium]
FSANKASFGYYAVASNKDGCIATSNSVRVSLLPSPIKDTIKTTSPSFCPGGSSLLSVSPKQLNVKYQWYKDNAILRSVDTNTYYDAVAAGTYTLKLTNTSCSIFTDPISVISNKAPQAFTTSPSGDAVICGGSATIKANVVETGLTYQWYSGRILIQGATSISYTTSTSGSFYIVANNGTCSFTSLPVKVSFTPAPATPTIEPSVRGRTVFCQNEGVFLTAITAEQGVSFQWYLNGAELPNSNATTLKPTQVGAYTLVLKNTAGCTSQASLPITINQSPNIPTISPASLTICLGNKAILTATGGAGYQWYNKAGLIKSSTFDTLNVSQSGDFYAQAVDAKTGCTSGSSNVSSVVVQQLPDASFTGLNQSYCKDGKGSVLTPRTTGGAFSGTGIDAAKNTFTPNVGGKISITYTIKDARTTCLNSSTQTTLVNTLPDASFGGLTAQLCIDSKITLAPKVAGGKFSGVSVDTVNNTFAPNSPGSYRIRYTLVDASTRCIDSTIQTTTVNALPVASFSGLASSYCSNDAAVSLTPTIVGGTFSGSGTDAIKNTFTPRSAGLNNITYTISDAKTGCNNSSTQRTNVNALPIATFRGLKTTYCLLEPSSVLTPDLKGGIFSGLGVDNSNNTFSATSLGERNISYTIKDAVSGCTNNSIQVAKVFANPNVSAGGANRICAGSSTTLNAQGASTYIWSPSTGLSSSTISNPVATMTQSQRYVVTGTDINGCKDTGAVTVNVSSLAAPRISASGPIIFCEGGKVTLTAITTETNVNYQWYSNNKPLINQTDKLVASDTGTYTVRINSTNLGCTSPASNAVRVLINPNPALVLSPRQSASSCANQPATLNATSTSPIQWFKDGKAFANNSSSFSATTGGLYKVLTTNAQTGCSSSDSVLLNFSDKFAGFLNTGSTFCLGDTLKAEASPTNGVEYKWSLNGRAPIISQSNIFYTKEAGNLKVTITLKQGCTDTISKVFTALQKPDRPSISGDSINNICNGSSIEFKSLTSNNTLAYQWYYENNAIRGATFPNYSTTISGVYKLKVSSTDGSKCSSVSPLRIVNLNPVPSQPILFSSTNTTFCEGEKAVLYIKRPLRSERILWFQDGKIEASKIDTLFEATITGYYKVAISNLQNCISKASDSILVKSNPRPLVSLGKDLSVCPRTSTSLTAGEWSTYSWRFNQSLLSTNRILDLNNPSPGSYTLEVSDLNGCRAMDTIIIKLSGGVVATSTITSPTCDGENGKIIIKATGLKPLKFSWNDNTIGNDSTANVKAGTYSVVVSDNNECKDTLSGLIVKSAPISNIIISTDLVESASCKNDGSIILKLSNVSGREVISWPDNPTLSGLEVKNLRSGSYSVKIQDGLNGCKSTIINVPVNSLNAGQIKLSTNEIPKNSEDGFILNLERSSGSSGKYAYQWQEAAYPTCNGWSNITASTDTSYDVPALQTSTCFRRQVIDLDCKDTAYTTAVTLNVRDANEISYQARIEGSGPIGSEIKISILSDRSQAPWTVVFSNLTSNERVTILVMSPDTSFISTKEGIYKILSVNGREGEFGLAYIGSEIDVRNAFSPNGDGDNEVFFIRYLSTKPNSLRIYNREGFELLSFKNYNNDWAGTNKDGKDLPDGTYYYVLKLDNDPKRYAGYFEIKR